MDEKRRERERQRSGEALKECVDELLQKDQLEKSRAQSRAKKPVDKQDDE